MRNRELVTAVLDTFPWFEDLSAAHRAELLDEFVRRSTSAPSPNDLVSLLDRWEAIAHEDARLREFEEPPPLGTSLPPGAR